MRSSLDNSAWAGVKQALASFAVLCLLATPLAAQAPPSQPAMAGKKVLAFGDSLTAGYGLRREEALPMQLQALFDAQKIPVTFIQAGVSGDTTAGGLGRLEWTLDRNKPDYAILALGANDMLRAIDPATTQKNLRAMLDIFKARKIPVLLAGMRAPASMGPAFAGGYDKMYASLAKEYNAVFYPFLLEGVAANPALNISDGVHPNATGVQVIARGLYPYVTALLKK